ncbi:MAG: hypothetical protein KDD55_05785, partial [Bdellovibrionales bacterium]|nr:hypothetical protein [Bdellovibrionales bacterium]
LFLNHPECDGEGVVIEPDETLLEVARFRNDYPHMKIHAFYHPLSEEHANIGFIRKFLNDVALLRHYKRGESAAEYYLLRVDADTHAVRPDYLENYLRRFEAHPEVDAFKGRLDWDWNSYLTDPAVLFGTRFYLAIDAYERMMNRDIGGGGANFAIRAARYADAGGYSDDFGLAEDVDLGRKVLKVREGSTHFTAIGDAGARSRLWTDGRRSIEAVKKGHAPVMQWFNGDTDFGVLDGAVRAKGRNLSSENYFSLLEPPNFEARMASMIQQTLRFFTADDIEKRRLYVDSILSKFGVEAEVDQQGTVIISDMSGLKSWLQAFGTHGKRYWDDTIMVR